MKLSFSFQEIHDYSAIRRTLIFASRAAGTGRQIPLILRGSAQR
jgi:hypothetical protein